jgi:hypothetical protein
MINLKVYFSLVLVALSTASYSADSASTKFNCKAKTTGLIHVLTIIEKDNLVTSFDYLSMQRGVVGQPSASCGIAASSENNKSNWERFGLKNIVKLKDSASKDDVVTLTSSKNKITLNLENIDLSNCGSSVGIATKIRLNKKSKVCEAIVEAN